MEIVTKSSIVFRNILTFLTFSNDAIFIHGTEPHHKKFPTDAPIQNTPPPIQLGRPAILSKYVRLV